MKKLKLNLILMTAAAAVLALSACQTKPNADTSGTTSQSSALSSSQASYQSSALSSSQASYQSSSLSSVTYDSSSSSGAVFDPDVQTKLPDSDRNDFEYIAKDVGTKRIEFGKYYGFSAATCVTRNLSFNNSKTLYGDYSLSSGLRPVESTLDDFCNLYNISSDNAITSYTSNNILTYHYQFNKNLLSTYRTDNDNSYVIIETCWSYQDGKWERMSVTDEIALAQGKSTLSSDAIFSVAIELDNETKSKVKYVYVSYGTPKEFNLFNSHSS